MDFDLEKPFNIQSQFSFEQWNKFFIVDNPIEMENYFRQMITLPKIIYDDYKLLITNLLKRPNV